MKKLLSIITVLAIIGILAAVGFFGYNKYQEVELEKINYRLDKKNMTTVIRKVLVKQLIIINRMTDKIIVKNQSNLQQKKIQVLNNR
ncbi:hypothetical protein [Staphylococcus sp. GDY8P110P]|uniref:hypothetical protein n=1 Tax=Staphylococcus sp. GDY8P110P TaxID=2804150 RepID=UPI001AEC4869|nr:hypothetical protein [Staphylococcus sp. GDY8P110P]